MTRVMDQVGAVRRKRFALRYMGSAGLRRMVRRREARGGDYGGEGGGGVGGEVGGCGGEVEEERRRWSWVDSGKGEVVRAWIRWGRVVRDERRISGLEEERARIRVLRWVWV